MTKEEYLRMCEELAKELTHCKKDEDLDYEFAALRLKNVLSDAAEDSADKGYYASARMLERCAAICRNSMAL